MAKAEIMSSPASESYTPPLYAGLRDVGGGGHTHRSTDCSSHQHPQTNRLGEQLNTEREKSKQHLAESRSGYCQSVGFFFFFADMTKQWLSIETKCLSTSQHARDSRLFKPSEYKYCIRIAVKSSTSNRELAKQELSPKVLRLVSFSCTCFMIISFLYLSYCLFSLSSSSLFQTILFLVKTFSSFLYSAKRSLYGKVRWHGLRINRFRWKRMFKYKHSLNRAIWMPLKVM